jgi:predicted DsbA family dithiol-disulfide isomerase
VYKNKVRVVWKQTAQAEKAGLDVPAFERCLSGGGQATRIRKDLAQGQAAGVTGTPAFLLAFTDPASTDVKAARFISGAQPYARFKAQIDALLAER